MTETANRRWSGPSEGAPGTQATDEVLDAVSASRRRTVLTVLEDRGDLELEALATAVAAAGAGGSETVGDDAVEEVLASLHHVHLPKLDEAGLAAYDREDGVARPTAEGVELPGVDVDRGEGDDAVVELE